MQLRAKKKGGYSPMGAGIAAVLLFLVPASLYAYTAIEKKQLQERVGASDEQMLELSDAEIEYLLEQWKNIMPLPIQQKTEGMKNSLAIKMSPAIPGPYESVELTVVNYITDLDRADISWYVNNTRVSTGKGEREIVVTTKGIGEPIKITVVITTIEKLRIDKSITIIPIEMDIIWEAGGYTPPFYKGKALTSSNAPQKIVAMPNFATRSGRAIPPGELIYTWRENGEVEKKSSGYGKNVFRTQASSIYEEKEVSVEVSSLDDTLRSYKKISAKPIFPQVLLYEDDPIEGIRYGRAMSGTFDLLQRELTVKAVPYFFTRSDKDAQKLTYEWSMNSTAVEGENDKLTLRQSGGAGSAQIGVAVANIAIALQRATLSLGINFAGESVFNF